MWEATLGLPEQARRAVEDARELAGGHRWNLTAGDVANVVCLGLGGSGVAADVLAAIGAPRLPVPVTAVKSYELPRFVGRRTLVFAVSCSGETEETLASAAAAWEAGATVVVVARGGALGELARQHGALQVPVPGDLPQPRTALGALALPPLVVLQTLGLLDSSENLFDPALIQLARRRDELASTLQPATSVARAIGRTLPLVHGAQGVGAVAARRWKTQVNENAKSPAFDAVQPELCHNEAAGWGQHGDVTRQVLTLVSLRCPVDHPQVSRRMDIMQELLTEVVHEVVEVRAAGENDLAQLLDLVMIGDVVSLLLAAQEGLDPGPIPVLDEIKQRMRSGT